ncbi:MAG: hypothetical protein IIV51_05940 [Lachnospiraceae bacterium]|nr:hypothetical protein [Lachnospiraceae bacterium]
MYKKDLNTSSGMWGLWNYNTYKHIDDYDKWEPLFCEDEDIVKQIESHNFVPVYIFEDGCRSFTIRVDEELSEREKRYVCVQSEEYLLKSTGKIVVSGIDEINKELSPNNVIELDMQEGYYSVKIFLLAWDEEPGAYLENGEINPDALSDFVVVVKSNADLKGEYRTKINTFSEDD